MKLLDSHVKNIWMLSREYGDIAGAGGVKDVVEQLSLALARWRGRRVSVILPLYGFIDPAELHLTPLIDPLHSQKNLEFVVDMNYASEEREEQVAVWQARMAQVNLYFLDSPRFREKRDIYTYSLEEEEGDSSKRRGEGHYDYFAMNLLLQKAALRLILLLQEKPDVIHCHDGHTAILPAIIAENQWLRSYFRSTGFLVTVHNAGRGYHQEVSDLPYAQAMTGLPGRVIIRCGLQDSFDPLIAAGLYGIVNTVSENYAKELQESWDDEQTGWFGHHLLDMGVKIEGVTNGIDPEMFDSRKGKEIGIAASFDPRDHNEMAGKLQCKKHLVGQLSSENRHETLTQYGYLDGGVDGALLTFIGRLSQQKGVDVLSKATELVISKRDDFQLVILGSGASDIEAELMDLALRPESAGRICFLRGYDPVMARKVFSGGDFFLVPSRYEPCGLTDFIAQLFGNVPVVHGIGGLVKIKDMETGISYIGNTPEILAETMERIIEVYRDKTLIRSLQKQAVACIEENYSWKIVMKKYLQLYKKAIALQMERNR